eukprot:GHVP01020848.1.p1 GENE.GHVP01020848.1~~GHVP01020848.1.p1  ORF type:complete len:135 (+),score=18.63 GHVP01020848.1:228-632(+)
MEGKYFLGQVWPFSFPISDYNVGGNVPNPTTNIGNRPSNNSCQAKCAEAGKAKSSKATDNYRKVPYIQASTSTETCSSSQDDSKERQIFLEKHFISELLKLTIKTLFWTQQTTISTPLESKPIKSTIFLLLHFL